MALEYKKSKVLRPYESVIILDPTASEEAQKSLFQKNKEIVSKFDGEVHSVQTWGKRDLANPIDKTQVGAYFHSYFTAAPEAILELERTMKINENVLRVVHAKLDETKSLDEHAEAYKKILAGALERQQEAEARAQKKRAARVRK